MSADQSETPFADLVIPFDELTDEQKDQAFCHHAATGGSLLFLKTGETVCDA
jgi:hypothetical protein